MCSAVTLKTFAELPDTSLYPKIKILLFLDKEAAYTH